MATSHVTTSSNLLIRNNTIEATGNADDGIAIQRNASFIATASAEKLPVTITASTNAEDGVEVVTLSS